MRSHSANLISHSGQHLLMPEVWKVLDDESLIGFRRGWRAEKDGGRLIVRSSGTEPTAVSPRYVIAADWANSALCDAAGIAMRGPVLANMGSAYSLTRRGSIPPAATGRCSAGSTIRVLVGR
ncbi:hypothetical protein A5724_13055 [Mycobacterium sp. ACS1612]|nr:hypothetical protein A5724_13055 [Mycobacterium sp. ACS1612]